MAFYEHTLIARPDLSGAQAQTLAETISAQVVELGGKVVKTEYWGLRNLAYRMRKSRKGHYLHLNIDAPSSVIVELERTERLNEDILRYLTVLADELTEEPSIVMVAKASRDERGRRDRGDGRFGDRERGSFGDRDRGDRDRGDREPRSFDREPRA